ncbi:MAG: ribonuclease P protein component [Clostridium sp.]|nr:MAG: ribonuclease P protein component [Clostridium sp.]
MKEEIRIKNKLEFDDFFKNSKGISNNYFCFYKKRKKKIDNVRVGIAIGTKFGKSI